MGAIKAPTSQANVRRAARMNAAPKLNPTTFEAFWHLGYGPRLLPITPPNAEAASQDARGEVPGIKGDDGRWHSLDWQHHETRPADLEMWTPMKPGIGCRMGNGLAAIDAHTLDTILAGKILQCCAKHFSVLPARVGNWPETLYLIRISGPFSHTRFEFGNKERVEILSEGKQAVFAGTHPKTSKAYAWPFPLVPFDQLPIVTPQQLTDFLNDLALILPAAKLVITEGSGNEASQAPLRDELSAVRKIQEIAEQHVRNSARLEQKALCMNIPAPGAGGSKMPVSPLAEEIAALVDRGYLPYLRPCAPPAVELHTRRGLKISDGKLPSTYSAGKWFGLPAWLTYEPKPTDVLEWSTWPGAGLCLVTGDVCAFDIDIKFAWDDESDAAKRGRRCITEIIKTITSKVGCEAKGTPIRGRANSTSCAFFVRLDSRIEKQVVTLFEAGSDRRHKVEFLASGQQIVIAGTHDSGIRVKSSLAEFALDCIPTISADALHAIMNEISAVAQRHGYATEKKAPPQKRALGAMKPDLVVAREIMRRRAEWVPSVVPCTAGTGDREWRISSTDLDRELEEDLCIYADGIFDHGTERSHTVISFIREFGVIEAGEISFGGCPRYGRRGKAQFAVIGEFEPAPRRPTEAEALNWLCHQLAGKAFPAFPVDAVWSMSWRAVAAAVDLDWRALEALQVNLLLDYIDDAGVAHPFDPSGWSAEDLKRNERLLPAIRATDPDWFAKLEFAWDFTGATSSTDVSAAIVNDAARVREHVTATGYAGIFAESPPLAPSAAEFSEPLDIFGDVDPAELSDPPPGSLPPVIDRWARSEARRKGVPCIFAAAAAIGVASSAVGSSLRIFPRLHDDGWLEPSALWLALVADPGSAKSPIISAAIEPLRRLDGERGKADQARHDAWAAAAKKKGKDNPDPGREPVVRRSVVDDVTMERQVRIHADNPRGLLRAPDELFGLFGSLGAYKKGADGDRSQVLRLFEGKEITVDRVGAGSIRADTALMGVVAGTQPEKLKTLVRDLSDDGMLQRFIFILHDGKERQGIDEAPDREALASYARTIKGLASAEYAYCPPIKLSADGYAALAEMNRRIASLKSIPATAAAWRGHVEKWGKFLPRLVLTFHALEEFSNSGAVDPEDKVSLATVCRAISFARFLLIRHSLRFYETYFGASEAVNEAREIAGFILSKGASLAELTRKTVYDARKDLRGPRNLPALLAAMAELENADWCAVAARQADGPTRWRVNPMVHDRFDERAVRERTNRAERQRRIIEAGKQRQEWSRMDHGFENEVETGFEGSK